MKKKTVFIASHTHWDRAWYFPFEQFRFLLVETMDELLHTLKTRDDFRIFNLDGQTVLLDDYLELRPEKKAELTRHIQSGRLTIGPWYTQPDEFLSGGESLIRNLCMGYKTAKEYGERMPAGYSADTFGHVAQLPQILRGVELDSFIFSRGLSWEQMRQGSVFRWKAPDGSWVYALPQIGFYAGLNSFTCFYHHWERHERSWKDVKEFAMNHIKKNEELGCHGLILLNNGLDHLPAEPNIGKAIKKLNRTYTDYDFKQAGFHEYAAAVKKKVKRLSTVEGALQRGGTSPILTGTLSMRMYLKQANADCQALLERLTEPLAVMGMLHGDHGHLSALQYAWKTLLKNHPHDDICGCSVDAVHDDMMTRFRNTGEVAEALCERVSSYMAYHAERPAAFEKSWQRLFAFNGTPYTRRTLLTAWVFGPREHLKGAVCDQRGKVLPTCLGRFREDKSDVWDPETQSVIKSYAWRQVSWWAELPACGYAQFALAPDASSKKSRTLKTGSNTIENEYLRVRMNKDGSVTIRDKKTGQEVRNGNVFENEADAGDTYDFGRLKNDQPVRLKEVHARVRSRVSGNAAVSVSCTMIWRLPEGLTTDRSRRSAGTVDMPVTTTASLAPGSRRVTFRTEVENRAKDHRLRVVFPTGVQSETVRVARHFDVAEMPVKVLPEPKAAQASVQTRACDEFVEAHMPGRSVTLFNRGLPEFEARPKGGRIQLVQTLLRCVGWLSREGIEGRPYHAGPMVATPGAQSPGMQVFDYAVMIAARKPADAALVQEAQRFTTPCYVRRPPAENNRPSLPVAASFLTVKHAAVSAMTPHQEGFLLRYWNPGDKTVKPVVELGFECSKAWRCNMLGRDRTALTIKKNRITLPGLKPKEIQTLLLKPQRAGQKVPVLHRTSIEAVGETTREADAFQNVSAAPS